MTEESKKYLYQLKKKYQNYDDNDSLMALADVESMDERVRELKIYREQPKTQELIQAIIGRYRACIMKLTNPHQAMVMSNEERILCFASMEWCMFTLDVIGEDISRLEQEVDKIIKGYAEKVGLIS
jgi:hypothetical protein